MPLPLLALAVPAITAGARVAAPAIGKAAAQGAAKNAGKAAPKAPAPKPQPPKQNNPPKPKDDKKPEPKKEEKKPEPKKEEKKPEPKKEEKKPEPKKDDKKPEPKKEEQKPGQPKKDDKKNEPKKDENKPGQQDKKPENKKEEQKPGQPQKDGKKPEPKRDENKPGQPKKDENKPGQPKKPTRDREDREELADQALDTTSQVIDRIMNRPGRDDDVPSDRAKPAGPKPKNPVVAPKAPEAGDLLVSLAVKNNGQDWFWFVHHPTEANTGMTMHAEGTITKGFTVKLTRKTTVDKLKSAAGTKSVELIKLQWVEKRWWDEDMFGANKAAKAEAPFETTAFGVKPPTVTECAPVKESASEMAMDRVAARIKRKDDKTWILESCEALVRAGALKQNVLTFLEKLKDSYGALGGKTPTGPDVSPAKPGKQPGRTCGTETPTKSKDSTPAGTPAKTAGSKPAAPKKTAPGKLPAAMPGLQGPGAIIAAQNVAKVAANAAAAIK